MWVRLNWLLVSFWSHVKYLHFDFSWFDNWYEAEKMLVNRRHQKRARSSHENQLTRCCHPQTQKAWTTNWLTPGYACMIGTYRLLVSTTPPSLPLLPPWHVHCSQWMHSYMSERIDCDTVYTRTLRLRTVWSINAVCLGRCHGTRNTLITGQYLLFIIRLHLRPTVSRTSVERSISPVYD